MSQMKTPPVRRSGGNLDVYTGLLFAALLVLAAGIFLLANKNISHTGTGSQSGSPFKLID